MFVCENYIRVAYKADRQPESCVITSVPGSDRYKF